MNRILIIILVALNFQAYAQEKILLEEPKVDKRVELLSIVFRLAERPEYSKKTFQLYDDRVERYFEEYKNHELIQFTKSMIKERGMAINSISLKHFHAQRVAVGIGNKPYTNLHFSFFTVAIVAESGQFVFSGSTMLTNHTFKIDAGDIVQIDAIPACFLIPEPSFVQFVFLAVQNCQTRVKIV